MLLKVYANSVVQRHKYELKQKWKSLHFMKIFVYPRFRRSTEVRQSRFVTCYFSAVRVVKKRFSDFNLHK